VDCVHGRREEPRVMGFLGNAWSDGVLWKKKEWCWVMGGKRGVHCTWPREGISPGGKKWVVGAEGNKRGLSRSQRLGSTGEDLHFVQGEEKKAW